jgi:hypothetical protein
LAQSLAIFFFVFGNKNIFETIERFGNAMDLQWIIWLKNPSLVLMLLHMSNMGQIISPP